MIHLILELTSDANLKLIVQPSRCENLTRKRNTTLKICFTSRNEKSALSNFTEKLQRKEKEAQVS